MAQPVLLASACSIPSRARRAAAVGPHPGLTQRPHSGPSTRQCQELRYLKKAVVGFSLFMVLVLPSSFASSIAERLAPRALPLSLLALVSLLSWLPLETATIGDGWSSAVDGSMLLQVVTLTCDCQSLCMGAATEGAAHAGYRNHSATHGVGRGAWTDGGCSRVGFWNAVAAKITTIVAASVAADCHDSID